MNLFVVAPFIFVLFWSIMILLNKSIFKTGNGFAVLIGEQFECFCERYLPNSVFIVSYHS